MQEDDGGRGKRELAGAAAQAVARGDLDFLREAVAVFAEAVMEAEVAAQAGAAYSERSPEGITRRTATGRGASGGREVQQRS